MCYSKKDAARSILLNMFSLTVIVRMAGLYVSLYQEERWDALQPLGEWPEVLALCVPAPRGL